MNESTNDGLVMIEIPCEECINGAVERTGATMPVACLVCGGTGRVELYGEDATDELERREIAKRKALKEYHATDASLGFLLNAEERKEFDRERPAKADRVRIAGRRADGNGPEVVGKAEMSRALGEKLVARLNEVYPKYVRRVVPAYPSVRLTTEERREIERRAEVAQLAAEGRSGSLARLAIPAAWPFDIALEASRDSRARRTNAHPATVAAFAYLAADLGRGVQASNGGWAK